MATWLKIGFLSAMVLSGFFVKVPLGLGLIGKITVIMTLITWSYGFIFWHERLSKSYALADKIYEEWGFWLFVVNTFLLAALLMLPRLGLEIIVARAIVLLSMFGNFLAIFSFFTPWLPRGDYILIKQGELYDGVGAIVNPLWRDWTFYSKKRQILIVLGEEEVKLNIRLEFSLRRIKNQEVYGVLKPYSFDWDDFWGKVEAAILAIYKKEEMPSVGASQRLALLVGLKGNQIEIDGVIVHLKVVKN